jgi:nucleotide-binding universal stress UspA family protein
MVMTVVVWVVENTWPACVQAAREQLRADEDVLLLHVSPAEIAEAAHGAFTGLLGRGHTPPRDPGQAVQRLSDEAAIALLNAAEAALGRPARHVHRTGRVEREVVAASAGARLLVLARSGDLSALGPRSLGPHTRFVVDHAPSAVLLVWPGQVPTLSTIPPGPGPGPGPGGPPPHAGPGRKPGTKPPPDRQ